MNWGSSCSSTLILTRRTEPPAGPIPTCGTVAMLRWGLSAMFKESASSSAVFPALFCPVMMLIPVVSFSSADSR
ncbi:hypothetical protein [Polyangium sp. 6x1]|uniref:hypothetical protein n=1 Tax=Polyangium sp. 6x1 TaxID=3042689 RepID=UPI002482DCE8|nr:hypothetical protein [Polyangium sp. 6x1]